MMDDHPNTEHHPEHSDTSKDPKTDHSMPHIPKVDMKGVDGKALKGGFGDVLEIIKLNKSAMDKVAHRDGEGINIALVYLAIGALGAPLGGAIFGYTFFGVTVRTPIVSAIVSFVLAVVMGFLTIYITSFVAEKMFHGQGKFDQYFRVMGYAALVNILGILTMVPFLAGLASIWLLVVNYFALSQIYKMNSTNTVLTIIVTIVAFLVLGAVVGALMATFGLAGGAATGTSFTLGS